MAYDDYLKGAVIFFQELDDLEKSGAAAEWEQRLAKLSADIGKSERLIRSGRNRLISDAQVLKPEFSEAQATEWVDRITGLQDSN